MMNYLSILILLMFQLNVQMLVQLVREMQELLVGIKLLVIDKTLLPRGLNKNNSDLNKVR